MKLFSGAFLGLLLWSQYTVGPDLAALPLSMIRDGDFSFVGYVLFALLAAIGIRMALAQSAAGHRGATVVFALAVGLLLLVAVTPSLNAWHEAGAASLMLLLFGYYAGLLILARTSWLYMHLAMPMIMMPLLGLGGYGPWQKGLIVYLLLLINLHWHWLAPAAPRRAKRQRGEAMRRRVIYVVEAGKSWTRRRRQGSTSCAT